jgi:LacI family transcriptional regulator
LNAGEARATVRTAAPAMPPESTLDDVARRAGVHRSTVSLALRNNPRIRPEVRERIQAIAKEIGYRVNPLVATLMRSRRTGRKPKHVSLAYVTNYPTRYGWRPPHHDRPDFFPGAQARAEELGYKLEHFWLGEPGMTPARMSDILSRRAITGVLIGRLPPGQSSIELGWDRFAAVALGYTLRTPALHHVAEDAFTAVTELFEQCLARGYRRPGFFEAEIDDSPRWADRLIGAFQRQQLNLPPRDQIPLCRFAPGPDFREKFLAWVRRERPDAIISSRGQPTCDWLRAAGYRVPEDIGVATLLNAHPEQSLSGIYSDPRSLGALATDMLVGMLHRGETGLPREPHYILLPGAWHDAGTLRPLPR